MVLALTLLGPRTDGPAYAASLNSSPIIGEQPQLLSQGCTFVLRTDKETYAAGESPVIEITASNPSVQAGAGHHLGEHHGFRSGFYRGSVAAPGRAPPPQMPQQQYQPAQTLQQVQRFAMSRMPSMPMPLVSASSMKTWSQECVVSLQPGETKTMTIPCDVKLPAGQDISIIMTHRKQTIMAASLTVQTIVVPSRPQVAAPLPKRNVSAVDYQPVQQQPQGGLSYGDPADPNYHPIVPDRQQLIGAPAPGSKP